MSIREDTKADVDHILGVFGGTDGGVRFVQFKTLIEDMVKKAEAGDQAAVQVLEQVTRFRRLLQVAEHTCPPGGKRT